ncbi:MAG: diguanylate cyclase [Actinobacteria bacterium]|uniref:Unannotated protein n=1 Tax=freshwater metagenome TaxID=449393 RepID=A0A6J7PV92_9ZZZZ|nr:diguanylate cyclase [Actinomycetota bacterium]
MRNGVIRAVGPLLLIVHMSLRLSSMSQGLWSELVLYNAIVLCGILLTLCAPRIADPFARPLIASALMCWFAGSLLSSLSTFGVISTSTQTLSNIAYLLFYPVAIIGISRLISPSRKFSLLEIFDSSIFGLGLSTLGAALVVKPLLPHFDGDLASSFFAVSYPIADLVLASITLSMVATQGLSKASTLLACGVLVFTATDFLYLWLTIQGTYSFGAVVDDGWLVGLLLISESLWHQSTDASNERGINPILIALSIFLGATVLAGIALKPGYFPNFVIFPAIITLLLAFIRMTIALKAAKNIGHERILARTDELTGLPNRRRLISEIENFVAKDGALLLLDLDGFKPVNDLHGHETGDKVLQQVALRFSRALPSSALLARLGGDEFGVLYEGSHESAMEVALALRATLSYPFRVNSDDILIDVSIGVAANNGHADLLKRADLAMYRAKREGLGVCRL